MMIDFNANINEQYTKYILFFFFQIHDDCVDSNNNHNTYVELFIMHTHGRKGKYLVVNCFSCVFKCTYKLLLYARLHYYSFIISSLKVYIIC